MSKLASAALALGAWYLATAASVHAQFPSSAERTASAVLRDLVTARYNPSQRWPKLVDVAPDLQTAYDSAGWMPLWSRDGQPTAQARAAIAELQAIETRGLDPADYDGARLQQRADAPGARPLMTADAVADFDVMLSSGTLRALRASRQGRVSAAAANVRLQAPEPPFRAAWALRAMAVSANPSRLFDEAEPPYQHYQLLKQALARYRTLARDTSLSPVPLKRPLHPDSADGGVPQLRRLLVALGDLPLSAARQNGLDSLRFDSVLVQSVQVFQRRHGLVPDGIVGSATLARINVPASARVAQIIVTLDRWRWLPHVFDAPPIFVNVPAFTLHAFTTVVDREAEVLSMDVVVGRAYNHKTPLFSGTMERLVFSPYWDVPPSIARKELLPLARRDADYLARNHYEILSTGEQALPTSALDAVAAGHARIRQRPGPDNALGGVKFAFPNAFNVYLHDTPAQTLFSRTRRDLSHGCIRLAEPVRLAQLVLRDQPEWDDVAIAEAMQHTAPRVVELRTRVPVYVLYGTAVAREDGTVMFYDDIYGLDRSLSRLLAVGYPYPH
ncbi:MAG: L,D-transpeptidase family protein [Gemmatimonadaceae bacterium]|nr:L,D-transpeptidase family protein [Gemmatimonadaceae bacterium]